MVLRQRNITPAFLEIGVLIPIFKQILLWTISLQPNVKSVDSQATDEKATEIRIKGRTKSMKTTRICMNCALLYGRRSMKDNILILVKKDKHIVNSSPLRKLQRFTIFSSISFIIT